MNIDFFTLMTEWSKWIGITIVILSFMAYQIVTIDDSDDDIGLIKFFQNIIKTFWFMLSFIILILTFIIIGVYQIDTLSSLQSFDNDAIGKIFLFEALASLVLLLIPISSKKLYIKETDISYSIMA